MDPTYLSPKPEKRKESCSFKKINNFIGQNGLPVASYHPTEGLEFQAAGD